MNELDAILRLWRDARGEDAVLATVVRVTGSAYRRPGARMLMLRDGRRAGSISGGCLESDLHERAWRLTASGRPALHTYNTMPEEDAIFGHGLGCQGIVDLLLEPVGSGGSEVLDLLSECRASGREAALATAIGSASPEARIGDRLLVNGDGAYSGALRHSSFATELAGCAAEVIHGRRNRVVRTGDCEIFVERVGPPVRLVILGAGHDAIPLATIAKALGWHVTVADARSIYAQPDRFPAADRVVLLPAHGAVESLDLGPSSVIVLMTHNYGSDARLLRRLLPLRPAYLGLLGPRVRTERLLAEVEAPDELQHLHSPAGLDIGAESPEGIALAIVAEIQAKLAGRGGGMLKHRLGPLHAAAEEQHLSGAMV
jgi:xanthine/CO dehydrogenase XdhC/CoxF family maturation factor